MITKQTMTLNLVLILLLLPYIKTDTCVAFPKGFKFGVSTSAYQIEGAWNEDGKVPHVWDVFSHTPGKIADKSNADVACDHYHRFLDDVNLIKNLNVGYYRMSVSWSRIFSNRSRIVNMKGVQHYIHEFKALKSAGIEPLVNIHFWDTPHFLQEEINGFVDPRIVDEYVYYAETCFKYFGDYVSNWITFNEPYVYSWLGHGSGVHAPGRCSIPMCKENNGNSSTEPYLVAHHILLAHGKTVQLFRRNYKGRIGIVLNSDFALPYNESDQNDIAAANRYLEFLLGWFAHPLIHGDYNPVMKRLVGSRLPKFTNEEIQLIKGSLDFLGVNHYTTPYIKNGVSNGTGWIADKMTIETFYRNGVAIGPMANSPWFYVYPPGIRKLMNYIKNTYGDIEIWITENGVDAPNESNLPFEDIINDTFRKNYFQNYIPSLRDAITIDKVNIKAYFVWSLMDNFEYAEGLTSRFGIYYVNYTSLERTLKSSGAWYRDNVVTCNK